MPNRISLFGEGGMKVNIVIRQIRFFLGKKDVLSLLLVQFYSSSLNVVAQVI